MKTKKIMVLTREFIEGRKNVMSREIACHIQLFSHRSSKPPLLTSSTLGHFKHADNNQGYCLPSPEASDAEIAHDNSVARHDRGERIPLQMGQNTRHGRTTSAAQALAPHRHQQRAAADDSRRRQQQRAKRTRVQTNAYGGLLEYYESPRMECRG